MKHWLLSVIVLFVSGCATTAEPDIAQQLADLMVGDFASLPADRNQFVDRRRRLSALGEGHWVYLQLNSGSDRVLYRQRLLQLVAQSDGSILQRTYSLQHEADKRDLIEDSERLGTLVFDDLEPAMAEGCDMVWRAANASPAGASPTSMRFRGVVSPDRCVIQSKRRNQPLAIGAETLLGVSAIWQAERGFDLQGNALWGSAPGEFNKLRRTTQ
ncbi:MAG: chromophore lyase CpcT/CpeT [Pseudomonadota bacterium]